MVGIIVLNYKNWEETIECIKSIVATTNIDYQIFIVDNNSPNDSLQQLEKHFEDQAKITILDMDENRGYAAGNNQGITAALNFGCDSIVIANPDVIFYEGAIEKMVSKLNSSDDLGVVGPKVLCADFTSIQKITRKLLTFKRYLSIKKPMMYLLKKTQRDYLHAEYDYTEDLIFEGMVSGCCFAIKADIMQEIGGFDENTFLFGEEDIISYKLKELNKMTCVCIDAVVVHLGSTTIGKKVTAFNSYYRYVSAFYVLVRYSKINKFQRMIVSLINLGAFWMRSLFNADYRLKLKPLIKEYREIVKKYK